MADHTLATSADAGTLDPSFLEVTFVHADVARENNPSPPVPRRRLPTPQSTESRFCRPTPSPPRPTPRASPGLSCSPPPPPSRWTRRTARSPRPTGRAPRSSPWSRDLLTGRRIIFLVSRRRRRVWNTSTQRNEGFGAGRGDCYKKREREKKKRIIIRH